MPLNHIPVVDLFAGPGGLSEGFSSLIGPDGNAAFDVRVSIEKNPHAFETLKLRSFFRAFPKGRAPERYYDYLRGNIGKQDLLTNKSFRDEWEKADREAHCATLGETPHEIVDGWIREGIGDQDPWVLIGGPPCQAYSVVGRSRMRGGNPQRFEKDERHFLYLEYLRIIRKFKPAVFVMENVKGILSSTHGGSPIFGRIIEDLSRPDRNLDYDILSFVRETRNLKPNDFVIAAENYGIPQRRHRVILFGVRRDYAARQHRPLVARRDLVSVWQTIAGMPKVRSRLSLKSPKPDSFENWLDVLRNAPGMLADWRDARRSRIEELMAVTKNKRQYLLITAARYKSLGHASSYMRYQPRNTLNC